MWRWTAKFTTQPKLSRHHKIIWLSTQVSILECSVEWRNSATYSDDITLLRPPHRAWKLFSYRRHYTSINYYKCTCAGKEKAAGLFASRRSCAGSVDCLYAVMVNSFLSRENSRKFLGWRLGCCLLGCDAVSFSQGLAASIIKIVIYHLPFRLYFIYSRSRL
jgi:hypothetical protein